MESGCTLPLIYFECAICQDGASDCSETLSSAVLMNVPIYRSYTYRPSFSFVIYSLSLGPLVLLRSFSEWKSCYQLNTVRCVNALTKD